jgi:predicted nucleic acid-binding protein
MLLGNFWTIGPKAAFVDSQAWVALVFSREENHEAACGAYKQLVKSGWYLYTSNWTLYDAYSHIKERTRGGGLSAAQYLRDLVSDTNAISVLRVDRNVEKAALNMFWQLHDKTWSVTTCANVMLIRDKGLDLILSGNKNYQQAGLRCLY